MSAADGSYNFIKMTTFCIAFCESYLSTVIVNENLQEKGLRERDQEMLGGYGRREREMGWEVQDERVDERGGGNG